jgi:hypothetical protein
VIFVSAAGGALRGRLLSFWVDSADRAENEDREGDGDDDPKPHGGARHQLPQDVQNNPPDEGPRADRGACWGGCSVGRPRDDCENGLNGAIGQRRHGRCSKIVGDEDELRREGFCHCSHEMALSARQCPVLRGYASNQATLPRKTIQSKAREAATVPRAKDTRRAIAADREALLAAAVAVVVGLLISSVLN